MVNTEKTNENTGTGPTLFSLLTPFGAGICFGGYENG